MNDPISPPETLEHIMTALEAQSVRLGAFLSGIPAARFFDGSNESWSPAHHVKHLTQSVNLLALGFGTPERQRPAPDGTRSRAYVAVRDAYREALGDGVQVRGPFVPALEDRVDRATYQHEIIAALRQSMTRFSNVVSAWPDERLDHVTLKHPLLGPITAREMALFTLYHNEHHRAGIEKRL